LASYAREVNAERIVHNNVSTLEFLMGNPHLIVLTTFKIKRNLESGRT